MILPEKRMLLCYKIIILNDINKIIIYISKYENYMSKYMSKYEKML
jgi:hypothetical protein